MGLFVAKLRLFFYIMLFGCRFFIIFADMNGLSILIPTFNDECFELVGQLRQQALKLNVPFEILIGDDGSSDRNVVESNLRINQFEHCSCVLRPENSGRAVIRNVLGRMARYDTLLFIDSDMSVIRQDYLSRYINSLNNSNDVVYGGYELTVHLQDNLRSRYEDSCADNHTAEKRALHPYLDFHTSNFACPASVFHQHPLDERFRSYGYEDVFYGRQLKDAGIAIRHIDNPLGFGRFESNADYLRKTEEGLRTLWRFRENLQGYSRLLDRVKSLRQLHLLPLVHLWHRCLGGAERRQLMGNRPRLFLFNLYRLGYFASLDAGH